MHILKIAHSRLIFTWNCLKKRVNQEKWAYLLNKAPPRHSQVVGRGLTVAWLGQQWKLSEVRKPVINTPLASCQQRFCSVWMSTTVFNTSSRPRSVFRLLPSIAECADHDSNFSLRLTQRVLSLQLQNKLLLLWGEQNICSITGLTTILICFHMFQAMDDVVDNIL